jgi:hypothetical protein
MSSWEGWGRNLRAGSHGFGAWFARRGVQRQAGRSGVSPSPSHRAKARHKLLKKRSLGMFQSCRFWGYLMTGSRLAEMGNSWAISKGTRHSTNSI